MWWIIIGIISSFIILSMIKDTHVKMYRYGKLIKQYDPGLPVWLALIVVFMSAIPGINIGVLIFFLTCYLIKTMSYDSDLAECDVFSLNGNTWLTKNLLLMKKVLSKKI